MERLTVRDEENDREFELLLEPEEIQRAMNDRTYLERLIADHDQRIAQEHGTADDDDNSESRNSYIWTEPCVMLLLSLYEEHQQDFQTKRHKKVYDTIAEKMRNTRPQYTVTGGQCQSKIHGLKKTYKKILDHNSTSGNDRATWPYFDRMNELFSNTGWASPVATASEAGPENSELPQHPSPTSSSRTNKKRKSDMSLAEFITEKRKLHEEKMQIKKANIEKVLKQKEQHHKEKMELLWAIRNSFNQNNP